MYGRDLAGVAEAQAAGVVAVHQNLGLVDDLNAGENMYLGRAYPRRGLFADRALPSLAGERYPVRDPDARGVLVWLSPATAPAQMYRAMLEGVAQVLGTLLDALPVAECPLPVCGGGTARPVAAVMADITERPIVTVDAAFSAAFGAATSTAPSQSAATAPRNCWNPSPLL
ncbi:hypothetical protein Acor_15780 [Acrocarpospora corrugata]|uniref:Carbohydrate kinase FGGY C-terminal domain-containing protein n=1 Tax=Acrocarpospora corrugata TaxID=35763 RepID=A0A5M3VRW4_9ACTN|nr:FGGY-family carbohydrate kinase [Acrocarpospora corrugata]GER99514.1 hypothetical protein Acor_15780 [Acrocarpospora corrugata]